MERVILDGVEYLKAAAAAKQFRYTSDYIGQLCRAKKIDARLVGRTWFVNPDSIVAHKKTKYKAASEPEKKAQTTFERKFEESPLNTDSADKNEVTKPKSVPPVRTSKAHKGAPCKFSIPVVNERTVPVSYEADTESLLPNIKRVKNPFSKKIVINPADAQKLKIKNKKKLEKTIFSPSDIPEVSLSGRLSISTYETKLSSESNIAETPDYRVNKAKNKDITDKQENDSVTKREKQEADLSKKDKVSKPKILHNTSVPVAMKRAEVQKIRRQFKVSKKNLKPALVTAKSVVKTVKEPNFTKTKTLNQASDSTDIVKLVARPAKVTKLMAELKELSKGQSELNQKTAQKQAGLWAPMVSTVLAILCVGLIFSASVSTVSFGDTFSSEILLQMANLREIFSS